MLRAVQCYSLTCSVIYLTNAVVIKAQLSQRDRATLHVMSVETLLTLAQLYELEMWANAQRDGRPAKYRWRPLFNAAKFG